MGYDEPHRLEQRARGHASFGAAVLYAAFTATGVALVLPGALLPVLLARWSLNDEQAGLLFFLFFLGSMSGAVLSRGSLPRSIARGCAAVALGASLLAVASHGTAFAAMALFGLGLGIVMTSVSVLVSRSYPADRAAHITRLNLLWALGACFGPGFELRGAAAWGAPWMLYAIAAAFAVLGLLTLLLVEHVGAEPVSAGASWWRQLRRTPVALLLMVPLATGIESAAGGWLATYSKRSGGTLDATIGAVTCFWAGLLLSRLVQSNRRISTSTAKPLLRLSPWLMSAALALLVAANGGALVPVAALLLGLGIGPTYPAVLARVLHCGEGGNAVFVAAGVGASVLPLLTGLVSGRTGSLRLGLCVPLFAALAMVLCGWIATRRDVFSR
ncbi:MAG TPA: MFS transporter [Acidobacteriaceae bacterium]|nr:MFS transporter [Acidobacteriaceae bacterium]